MSKENVRQPLVLLTTRIANYTSITSPKLEWQIHFSQFNKWCTGSPNKKKRRAELLTSDMIGYWNEHDAFFTLLSWMDVFPFFCQPCWLSNAHHWHIQLWFPDAKNSSVSSWPNKVIGYLCFVLNIFLIHRSCYDRILAICLLSKI